MMLDYLKPEPATIAIRWWNRSGNRPTLDAYLKLKSREQQKILDYLKPLPTHLEVEISRKRFYLLHGFLRANVHNEVWHRPEMDTLNPIPDWQLIIGHTPV